MTLDSGSFTLWTKAKEFAKENKCGKWGYYETEEFYKYLDDYAAFIKKYHYGIDYYANVDVIPNPELSWRSQQYLEMEHGLDPIPVIHFTTDVKWLQKYIDLEYPLIALGGLVGSTKGGHCRPWLDQCFNLICNNKEKLPATRIHGFGITAYNLLLRYPWYSVDSSSWAKVGGFGGIFVPHKRMGKFTFSIAPYNITMSNDSPRVSTVGGKHYATLTEGEKNIVLDWLEKIEVPLGRYNAKGEIEEHGVVTRHTERKAANVLFFEHMRASLPEYPWPFNSTQRKGFSFR